MLEEVATAGAPGSWTEITARVQPEGLDAVSEALSDFSGGGVAIEPPIQALGPDEGYTLDTDAAITVRAYAYGPISTQRRAAFRRRLSRRGLDHWLAGRLQYRTLREEDWAEAWKEHYEIERAGRVVIRPAWIDYQPKEGEVVVNLDPGMAFGTGQHPTTRMCLLAMQDLLSPGSDVLDLGTGSGILAIAAVKLGAGRCIATDIEPQAVDAARSNVALNGLEGRIEILLGSLDIAPPGDFDVIFANINASTIIRLAEDLAARLRPGAFMLAGGVIAERESETRHALEAAALSVDQVLIEGDWRTLIARR
jgi:ribosomal protein L11 methyltransferase